MTLKIDTMFAFIAENEEGEGVVGVNTPMGWMPLVGADMNKVEQFRGIAQGLADSSDTRIVIAKFEVRTNLETIEPLGVHDPSYKVVDIDPETHQSTVRND